MGRTSSIKCTKHGFQGCNRAYRACAVSRTNIDCVQYSCTVCETVVPTDQLVKVSGERRQRHLVGRLLFDGIFERTSACCKLSVILARIFTPEPVAGYMQLHITVRRVAADMGLNTINHVLHVHPHCRRCIRSRTLNHRNRSGHWE